MWTLGGVAVQRPGISCAGLSGVFCNRYGGRPQRWDLYNIFYFIWINKFFTLLRARRRETTVLEGCRPHLRCIDCFLARLIVQLGQKLDQLQSEYVRWSERSPVKIVNQRLRFSYIVGSDVCRALPPHLLQSTHQYLRLPSELALQDCAPVSATLLGKLGAGKARVAFSAWAKGAC